MQKSLTCEKTHAKNFGPTHKNFGPTQPTENDDPHKKYFDQCNSRNQRKNLTQGTHVPMQITLLLASME